MEVKVLFTRGDGVYLIQKGEYYYLVNIEDNKASASPYIDSFLKFGYFEEVDTVDEETLEQIKQLLQ